MPLQALAEPERDGLGAESIHRNLVIVQPGDEVERPVREPGFPAWG